MVCQRCSHPLPPLADRCLRCFALNPREPGPALSIESDPPAPVARRFTDVDLGIEWHSAPRGDSAAAATDRFASPPLATARPVWTPAPHPEELSEELAPPAPSPSPSPPRSSSAPPSPARRPAAAAQLLAWSVDLSLVLLCAALHVGVATALLRAPAGSADSSLDLLLRGPRLPALWAALSALLAIAYSWLFTTLGGRTPGLALAGLRVESKRGGTLTVGEALARAALAVPSAALGLSGFALALVDPRGQTLHDKLSGAIVVRA